LVSKIFENFRAFFTRFVRKKFEKNSNFFFVFNFDEQFKSNFFQNCWATILFPFFLLILKKKIEF